MIIKTDEDIEESDGWCREVNVHESREPEERAIVYDHAGNPFVRAKIKMGFDLDD